MVLQIQRSWFRPLGNRIGTGRSGNGDILVDHHAVMPHRQTGIGNLFPEASYFAAVKSMS